MFERLRNPEDELVVDRPMPMRCTAAGLWTTCEENGTLTFQSRWLPSAFSEDGLRVDVIDVLFPLYALLVAVSSGAYSKMLRGSG
jgi:hypothetical protein